MINNIQEIRLLIIDALNEMNYFDYNEMELTDQSVYNRTERILESIKQKCEDIEIDYKIEVRENEA